MIIGQNFVWMHFPKCAGLHTHRVLKKNFGNDPKIHFDIIDTANVIWHQNVIVREKETGQSLKNRDIICNFRRLPSWIISRIQYEKKRSGFSTTRTEYTRGIIHEVNGVSNHADYYVKYYTKSPVKNWIRTEYILADFENAFSPYLNISGINLSNEFSKKSNVTSYDTDLRRWFTQNELEILYSCCPLWANLELSLYGDLVSL